jgi:hypothetical protein
MSGRGWETNRKPVIEENRREDRQAATYQSALEGMTLHACQGRSSQPVNNDANQK